MKDDIGTVYLIHLDSKYKHAQHYIGFTTLPVGERLERHRNGNGAKLLRACNNAGINYDIIRIWENVTFEFEKLLKKRKNAKRYCPICNNIHNS